MSSILYKQETEYVRDAEGRDGSASSKTPKVQLGPLDDVLSSPGQRELTPSHCHSFILPPFQTNIPSQIKQRREWEE